MKARTLLYCLPVMMLFCVASAASAATCQVTAGSIAFGTYDPLSATTRMSSGTIEVTCFGANETVTLEILANVGYASGPTRMQNLSKSALHYSLFLDPGRTQVWGDGTNGTATIHDALVLSRGSVTRTYNVFGQIPGSQRSSPAGIYHDQLIVTLRY